jgi:uncharacterized membrane protein YphA (DoxX/SURF4 family)
MQTFSSFERTLTASVKPALGSPAVRLVAYLGLCGAYLQGGVFKLLDFPGALREMDHFGLSPATVFAVLVILMELGASLMILTGRLRWLGALGLAGFTLMATAMTLRFWELTAGPERFMITNSFYEHLGLVGGFLLVAFVDMEEQKPS